MKDRILTFLSSNEAKLIEQHKAPVHTLDIELRQAIAPYFEYELYEALEELRQEGKITMGETLNYKWIKLTSNNLQLEK